MKKLLLLFCLCTYFTSLNAQVAFCASGAQWKYIYFSGTAGWTQGEALKTITYTGDSVSGTETFRILTYFSFYKDALGNCSPKILIRQKGDTIFMKNCNTLDNWQILYNFAATAGQHWTTTVKDFNYYAINMPITHTVVVNAVSTVTLNGMALKRLHVSFCYLPSNAASPTCENAVITERIGCDPYLFNYYNEYSGIDHPHVSKFLCYSDNTIGQVSMYGQYGCSYSVGLAENKLDKKEFNLYPQPAGASVHINFENTSGEPLHAMFFDLSGREVKSAQLGSASNTVDINTLDNGLYLLKISNKKGELVYQNKFLKQN